MRFVRLCRAVGGPRLIIEALILAIEVEVRLRAQPFERVLSSVRDGPAEPRQAMTALRAEAVQQAINVAYRVLRLESTCLKKALVFCRIYQRRGFPAVLRIGVQKTEDRFSAHAWVEDGTGQLLTDPLEGFSPVPLPGAAAIRADRANR